MRVIVILHVQREAHDQILVKGVQPDSSWVLPANGSDHRPVEARISW
jgi:endonuclease/exonuclease/phosphatase (EEP) superfamily protein YafD